MIWARWAGVMGAPMKWEIARIFVVGTGGSGFCAEAAPSGVIGFFMAVAPYSSSGILLLIVSVFDARTRPLVAVTVRDVDGGEVLFAGSDPIRQRSALRGGHQRVDKDRVSFTRDQRRRDGRPVAYRLTGRQVHSRQLVPVVRRTGQTKE